MASALLTATLLPACGGSESTTTTSSTGSSSPGTSTSSSGTTPTGTSTTSTTAAKKKRNVVAWILGLGPGAPDGPAAFSTYGALEQLRCREVYERVAELDQPAKTLYTGAADACRAAFDGRGELWPRSAAALAAVAARTEELSCLDLAALSLLRRLVTAHQEHPGRQFRTAAPGKSKAPPCPSIAALSPDHGTEGTVVRMTGRNLGAHVVAIRVVESSGNSFNADFEAREDGSLDITMPGQPSSEASGSVCVVARANPQWSADGARFTYSDATGPPAEFACPPPDED